MGTSLSDWAENFKRFETVCELLRSEMLKWSTDMGTSLSEMRLPIYYKQN